MNRCTQITRADRRPERAARARARCDISIPSFRRRTMRCTAVDSDARNIKVLDVLARALGTNYRFRTGDKLHQTGRLPTGTCSLFAGWFTTRDIVQRARARAHAIERASERLVRDVIADFCAFIAPAHTVVSAWYRERIKFRGVRLVYRERPIIWRRV